MRISQQLRGKAAICELRGWLDCKRDAHSTVVWDADWSTRALVDVISIVKQAAKEAEPLLTASERVERAFARLTAGRLFTREQERWLGRIREHLIANLSVNEEDFVGEGESGVCGKARGHF